MKSWPTHELAESISKRYKTYHHSDFAAGSLIPSEAADVGGAAAQVWPCTVSLSLSLC